MNRAHTSASHAGRLSGHLSISSNKPRLAIVWLLLLSVVLSACGGTDPTATVVAPAATNTTAAAAAPTNTTAAAAAPTNTTAAAAAPTDTAVAAVPSGDAVNIRIFTPQGTDQDLPNNSFTKFVEQSFNIKFTFETTTFDTASAKEKRQISLASGDYPDLYMLVPWLDPFTPAEILKYGQQGVLIPLNDLIDQYAPNVKAALEKYPYFKAQSTAPDGKIYGINQVGECYHCTWPSKTWVNSTWLKKLGLKPPTTTAEYKTMLEAFKNGDPNGNGKADELPLSGSTAFPDTSPVQFLMNAFIYNDEYTYLTLENGKVDFAANKPGWKKGLEYLQSLYAEGLIDQGAFTQNWDAYQALGANADAELIGNGPGMHPAIFVNPSNAYSKDYDALAPLTGPDGASFATYNYPSGAGAMFLLTNKASPEVQVAAMKYLNYLFTPEGAIRGIFGEEGKDWRKPQAGDLAIEDGVTPLYATIPVPTGDTPHNSNWGPTVSYYNPKSFRDGWVQATDIYAPEGYERRLQEATHLYDGKQPKEVFPHWAVWPDLATVDELATLQTNIKSYVDQNALQFTTGERDLNADWDSYVAGLEQVGLTRYLELRQKQYDSSTLK